jgi:radical SAM protein with 4Fe4S-binding SPASM domain
MPDTELLTKLNTLGCRGYPTTAQFEITHRCNCTCDYCYLNGCHQPDLPLQDVCSVISTLNKSGIFSLTLTGGEIFMRPDLLPILQHAVDCDFFDISLLSNGTLIKDDHVAFIAENPNQFKSLQLSIFSDSPEENDRFMGFKGATRRTLSAAQKLKDAGLKVQFALPVQPFNVGRIGSIMDYYEHLGYSISISVHKIITSHNNQFLQNHSTYEFFKTMFSNIGKNRLARYRKALDTKLQNPKRKSLCSGIYCTMSIDPQGTVFPCPSFREYPIGNIIEQPDVHALFTSAPMQFLHRLSLEDYPQCAECRNANFCSICIGKWHTQFHRFGMIDDQFCNFVHALADVADA